jgi:hypothetical protein
MATTHFSVVDGITYDVIGTWVKYEDALQFWNDTRSTDDHYCIFPTDEVIETADV